jgi:hypothetical protein
VASLSIFDCDDILKGAIQKQANEGPLQASEFGGVTYYKILPQVEVRPGSNHISTNNTKLIKISIEEWSI